MPDSIRQDKFSTDMSLWATFRRQRYCKAVMAVSNQMSKPCENDEGVHSKTSWTGKYSKTIAISLPKLITAKTAGRAGYSIVEQCINHASSCISLPLSSWGTRFKQKCFSSSDREAFIAALVYLPAHFSTQVRCTSTSEMDDTYERQMFSLVTGH